MTEFHLFALAGVTLLAAFVNGALGYGFSSITVPLALLFMANRVLNPALVLIEVALNAYVLWVNRDALSGVWRRLMPMVIRGIKGAIGDRIDEGGVRRDCPLNCLTWGMRYTRTL